tara:strand:- start:576 stop:1463 length:888 start_codon:yes stop_codon:yes gene_type:complete
MMTYPDFFIVGGTRCGTTSLCAYLKQHPNIFLPKRKELDYYSKSTKTADSSFSRGFWGHREWSPIENKQDYLQLFEDSKEDMVVGDGSATYLMNLDAPKLISQDNPNAKIIISLRNPIERTHTAYLAQYRTANEKHSFGESIRRDLSSATGKELQNLRSLNSDYYEYVKNYYSYFPKEQIKIIIFEEFIKNPQQTMKEILHFLNLSTDINFEYKQHNPVQISKNKISQSIITSKFFYYIGFALMPAKIRHYILRQFTTRTKPIMLEKDRDFLKEQYVERVKKLESLLNRKIPWEI